MWIWDNNIRGYRAPTEEEKSEGLTWDSESRSYRPYTPQEKAALENGFEQRATQEEARLAKELEKIGAFERELWRSTRIPGIPKDQVRACFLEFQGYSLRNIAEDMEVSHTQAAKLIKAGREKFQEVLRKHGMRFGRREMAREALGLAPDRDRMAMLRDRDRDSDTPGDGIPASGARKPSMGEQENK